MALDVWGSIVWLSFIYIYIFGSSLALPAFMDNRPLVASAATGSLSSLILWLVHESFNSNHFTPDLRSNLDLVCPSYSFGHLIGNSEFLAGLICGLLLWPFLEIAVLTKQWLVLSLKHRIGGSRLYKVIP